MASIFERISMLGDPIAQHHFTDSFEGFAVALYQIEDNTIGTHFVAVLDPETIQVMRIMSERDARIAYRMMVDGIHVEQFARIRKALETSRPSPAQETVWAESEGFTVGDLNDGVTRASADEARVLPNAAQASLSSTSERKFDKATSSGIQALTRPLKWKVDDTAPIIYLAAIGLATLLVWIS